MEKSVCSFCNKQKTSLACSICECISCKNCSQVVDEDSFEFLSLLPDKFINKIFCPDCFGQHISSELSVYQEIMGRAKNVNVYLKDQGKETRLMRRIEKIIYIKECDDKEELLMRLAFLAAQKGYDTIVDVSLTSKKAGKGSYKKLIWNGSATPIDSNKKKF